MEVSKCHTQGDDEGACKPWRRRVRKWVFPGVT